MFKLEPEPAELVDSERVSRVMLGGQWVSVIPGTFRVISPVAKQARRNPGAAQAMFFEFVREERSLLSGGVICETIGGPLHNLQAWATPDEEPDVPMPEPYEPNCATCDGGGCGDCR